MSAAVSEAGIIHRTPRWMWISLILSLAVNLMVLGVVFGSMWAVRHGGLWDIPVALDRSHRFMQGLPSERRSEIKAIFFDHKRNLAPYWREVREARIAIGKLIKSGGYSAAEFNAAMDLLFQKEAAARMAAKPMISDIVARLQPDERLHFLSVFLPYLDEAQAQPTAQSSP
jgi:uncharacterized membrane protein